MRLFAFLLLIAPAMSLATPMLNAPISPRAVTMEDESRPLDDRLSEVRSFAEQQLEALDAEYQQRYEALVAARDAARATLRQESPNVFDRSEQETEINRDFQAALNELQGEIQSRQRTLYAWRNDSVGSLIQSGALTLDLRRAVTSFEGGTDGMTAYSGGETGEDLFYENCRLCHSAPGFSDPSLISLSEYGEAHGRGRFIDRIREEPGPMVRSSRIQNMSDAQLGSIYNFVMGLETAAAGEVGTAGEPASGGSNAASGGSSSGRNAAGSQTASGGSRNAAPSQAGSVGGSGAQTTDTMNNTADADGSAIAGRAGNTGVAGNVPLPGSVTGPASTGGGRASEAQARAFGDAILECNVGNESLVRLVAPYQHDAGWIPPQDGSSASDGAWVMRFRARLEPADSSAESARSGWCKWKDGSLGDAAGKSREIVIYARTTTMPLDYIAVGQNRMDVHGDLVSGAPFSANRFIHAVVQSLYGIHIADDDRRYGDSFVSVRVRRVDDRLGVDGEPAFIAVE